MKLAKSGDVILRTESGEATVLMVVGAGRGPLVRASLAAASAAGRRLRVYAVEKNANAVVTLQNLVDSEGCARSIPCFCPLHCLHHRPRVCFHMTCYALELACKQICIYIYIYSINLPHLQA